MVDKFKKIITFLKFIVKEPSLVNLVINSSFVNEYKFKNKYPDFLALPQVDLKAFNPSFSNSAETFFLDGSTLVTDLLLLKTLASREDVKNYFEIGTWRGESVHNVADLVEDSTTLNLSLQEMKDLGWSEKYAAQHGVLSKRNPKILHVAGNTKNFDFAGLKKKYDLIFIDGDHKYEMVLNDTKKVFKHLLHKNSIVVWHDYAFSPQKIRYEVFQAILDGVGKENHRFLYHPKNTLCAVFIREKLETNDFDEMKIPEKIFKVALEETKF